MSGAAIKAVTPTIRAMRTHFLGSDDEGPAARGSPFSEGRLGAVPPHTYLWVQMANEVSRRIEEADQEGQSPFETEGP